jgi:hypothetical protein
LPDTFARPPFLIDTHFSQREVGEDSFGGFPPDIDRGMHVEGQDLGTAVAMGEGTRGDAVKELQQQNS